MAFPSTSILDTFTGSDENPITSNWTSPADTGYGDLQRASNQLAKVTPNFDSAYYDVTTFGPDCEAYITMVTKPPTNDHIRVMARMNNVNTGLLDCFMVVVTMGAGVDDWAIQFYQGGTPGTLGAAFQQEVSDGDGIGISCFKDDITAWYRAGTAGNLWVPLATRTNTTFPNGGYLGIELYGTASGAFGDFGGGTMVSSFNQPHLQTLGRVRGG